jgi:hypothetical protein
MIIGSELRGNPAGLPNRHKLRIAQEAAVISARIPGWQE